MREGKQSLQERQYKLAIDARDKLSDNYHKWMSFYYVANGAVVVAITTLFIKDKENKGILLLSILGVFICLLWYLSCRGYNYWSHSWIKIITKLEKAVAEGNDGLLVYSAFSREVVEGEKKGMASPKTSQYIHPKVDNVVFPGFHFNMDHFFSSRIFPVVPRLAFLLQGNNNYCFCFTCSCLCRNQAKVPKQQAGRNTYLGINLDYPLVL